MRKWPVCMFAVVSLTAMALLCGCGNGQALAGGGRLPSGVRPAAGVRSAADVRPSAGVMSAAQACRQVMGRARGFLAGPEQVRLVLTTYAKGEPVESQGDISHGMASQTLVWVVEVHARAISSDYSAPSMSGDQSLAQPAQPAHPATDYSVVLNARTGDASDAGQCSCWPLPLSTVGTVVSLPPTC
jgi:hypothetical protein